MPPIFIYQKTMELSTRIYTAGTDSFADIRERHCIYADKTDLVYKLTHESKFVFLSRPRRFGKTLLCSTLECYFKGRKDLFDGLAMEKLETEWKQFPVFKFNLSLCKNKENITDIKRAISNMLAEYERFYVKVNPDNTLGDRLKELILRAHEQTGMQPVLLIDEYDAPLLDYLHKPDILEEVRRIMQEFFMPLKACGDHLRFVFITGITKFSHLSIFSTLNNLVNISMNPTYSAICGITQEELETVFAPDVELMAADYKCSPEEMMRRLKFHYDGYHFSDSATDIYNPFSLANSFFSRRIGHYWFSSGTPTYLFEQMKRFNMSIQEMEQMEVAAVQFDVPTESMVTALPLLYQSGYLTIKDYNPNTDKYILDFPNAEVKSGFFDQFLSSMLNIRGKDGQGLAGDIYASLLYHDTDKALQYLKAFFASIPYLDHGNGELRDIQKFEAYYETLLYVVFSLLCYRVHTQVKSVRGRAGIVVFMPDTTYVMELKIDAPAEEALRQIDEKGYMVPYESEGRNIVKIGISFSSETRTLEDWEIRE